MSPQLYLAAAIALLISLLGGLTYYYHDKYQGEITKNSVLENKNKELLLVIESDNEAVNKLAKDSKAREEAARLALVKVQKEFNEYVKRSQNYLLAQPTDKDLCTSANSLFNRYINQGVLK